MLICVLWLFPLFSQSLCVQNYNTKKGFILTYDNDTIRGLIKEKSDLSESILFQANGSIGYNVYTPNDISMFY